MSAQETAKAGINWGTLTDDERESLNYETCVNCGHTRQWHLWGDTCRKTRTCTCATFVGSGHDDRHNHLLNARRRVGQ